MDNGTTAWDGNSPAHLVTGITGYDFTVTPRGTTIVTVRIDFADGEQVYADLKITQKELVTYMRKAIREEDRAALGERLQMRLF